MTVAGRVWGAAKTALTIAAFIFVGLIIEYGDNCTRYRAPWCDFLDKAMAWIPPELAR